MPETVKITFLGTSAAPPQLKRRQSCIAIKYRDITLIVDMGEGAQIELLRHKISTSKDLYIILTHLHSDHTLGLVGFLASRNLMNMTNPITLIGPPGTVRFFYFMCLAFNFIPKYDVKIIETLGDVIINTSDFYIESFPVIHGLNSLGYRIVFHPPQIGIFNVKKAEGLGIPKGPLWKRLQEGNPISFNNVLIRPSEVLNKKSKVKPISIVISGDTIFNDEVINHAAEADLLIHDATYPPTEEERAKAYEHSTSDEAAKVAKFADVKQLVLTHISEMHNDIENSFKKATAIFPNTKLAYDGLKIELAHRE
ncbi:MAG: ribonuclease Z [Candidatus Heimdallarchaeaceae archaeon]